MALSVFDGATILTINLNQKIVRVLNGVNNDKTDIPRKELHKS
jgi:hypothetical protein